MNIDFFRDEKIAVNTGTDRLDEFLEIVGAEGYHWLSGTVTSVPPVSRSLGERLCIAASRAVEEKRLLYGGIDDCIKEGYVVMTYDEFAERALEDTTDMITPMQLASVLMIPGKEDPHEQH